MKFLFSMFVCSYRSQILIFGSSCYTDCSHQGNALYKIFMSTMEVIDQLKNSPVSQHRREWLQLMSILNSVLSWDFGVILCQSFFILVNVPGLCTGVLFVLFISLESVSHH